MSAEDGAPRSTGVSAKPGEGGTVTRFLTFAAVFAALAAPAALAADAPAYETVFAEESTSTFDVQVAGTYPARSEVLVKMRNNNQYAIPVPEGADLSVWRENMLVRVTITQGLVMDIAAGADATESFTYEVIGAEAMSGKPEDVLVRRITWVTPVEEVDVSERTVTFVAPAGDTREAAVAETVDIETFSDRDATVTLTYFDSIDIARR